MLRALTLENDFGEKLKSVLSDPEAMAKITAIASSLGMSPSAEVKNEESKPDVTPPEPNLGGLDIASVFSQLAPSSVSDPRVALLSSLKPFLREEKRGKIDALTRALSIASMMKGFRR